MTQDLLDHALGRAHREDAVLARTGGPAGNARLTAWTGLILLGLFLAELGTLVDLGHWLSWHIVIGVLLIPPALVKTGTTGWRMIRYYAGNEPYRAAGPPPMALRLLGPLVVLSTLSVLGTGLALILVSPHAGRSAIVAGVSLLMLHKATFLVWAAATGTHTVGRLIPAVRLVLARRIPGRFGRAATVIVTVGVSVTAAILALSISEPWLTSHGQDRIKLRHGHRIESR